MSETQETLLLTEARARGHNAAQAAADAATKIDPLWMEKAYGALMVYIFVRPNQTFTVEDVRKAATTVAEAPDSRAWGAVALKAKRAGLIVSVGYQPVESSNGSPKTLWKAVRQ